MATKCNFKKKEVKKESPYFSEIKSIIETAFYGNNASEIKSLKEAYEIAKNSPGTIVTDMKIHKPEFLGLNKDSKILVFNDGAVHSRCAQARRILGEDGTDHKELATILKEAVYDARNKNIYHAQSYVGLHEGFMVQAHLAVPSGHENLLYNWLLNFQIKNEEYSKLYTSSAVINESDIFVFSDPDWSHPDFPLGLAIFDPANNCAAILGMRYFGELKKGTLTLAWTIANRNGYTSCHGGLKRYNAADSHRYVMGFLGLSGSGKSTLTHSDHDSRYDVSILHDDAFIVSDKDASSIALEPSYFDKTSDYPLDSVDNKYLLSLQNCGVTLDVDGQKVVVCEDIRNSNGRAIKSKLWSQNRADYFSEKMNALVWLMKDESLPPVVKLTDATLAATMGALLATKRTSAERMVNGNSYDELVIVPYANPFRTYPLAQDYFKFKELFQKVGVECYILNTGTFMGEKIDKAHTLSIIEEIIEGTAKFENWPSLEGFQFLSNERLKPCMHDRHYIGELLKGMNKRMDYLTIAQNKSSEFNCLPQECADRIQQLISSICEIKNFRPSA